MADPDPQHHRAACGVSESLDVRSTVQGPAASPRRGRAAILAVPQGACWGLRPSSLSTSGPAGHPGCSSGRPQWGSGPA